ncbi:MAG: S49 family peptidase [Solirubrobacteraceae bacterium]
MTKLDAALLAQEIRAHQATPWGVHPQTLASISLALTGKIAGDALERPQAARGSQAMTGGVAVIPLRGLITPRPSFFSLLFGGGGGLQSFRAAMREAIGSDEIAAVLIDIDSPGGSTDLIAETAAEIRALRGTKPIVAIANTWAASAAYWLASQADELVVTPSGEVGSIGVCQAHDDITKLQEDVGVKTTLISAGAFKTEGNPYEPLSDEARAAIQAQVDDFYGMFVADVAKGRGVSVGAVKSGYGEGRMVTAKRAVELGMADRVDSYEATLAKLVRSPGRRRIAAAKTSGTPEPNPPTGGEEAPDRPSDAYIDLMYGTPAR